MKTILITGGAGFIGSNFAHYIYNKYPDWRIIVVDLLTYAGAVENLPVTIKDNSDKRFTFWYGDITNGELMDTLVSESDYIVHFAAESHVTRSIYDNTHFFMTDVIGTQKLCNAICKYKDNVERFVHISTSEVYGTALFNKMNEEHPLNPLSPYASAKCGADRLVYSYLSTYNLPATIIRPFNNFGYRQHLEKLIPRFITSFLLGEKLRIHGDGSAARDFVFAEDTCRAVDLVLNASFEKVNGQIFNIASEQHRSIIEIAEDIARCMGKDLKDNFEYVGDRPGQVFRHTGDASKIKRILGWEPEVSWENGLLKTIDWYRDNRNYWEKQIWMRDIPVITAAGKKELH